MMKLQLADIVLPNSTADGMMDLSAVFGNNNPVELEVGCGKGGFLLEQAIKHPNRNYLGIEWASKYYRFAADRMRRRGIENVRLVRADARVFSRDCLPTASLQAIHVYHPDPWPKRRHHDRRLFDGSWVDETVRLLTSGGMLYVQTDHAPYFDVICGLLRSHTELEARFCSTDLEDNCSRLSTTNFQMKYAREGRKIYRTEFRRL